VLLHQLPNVRLPSSPAQIPIIVSVCHTHTQHYSVTVGSNRVLYLV
jgi:hypothetical protein